MNYFKHKKKENIIGIIFIALMLIFSGYIFLSTNLNRQKNLSYNFNGVIKKVTYDVKGIPTLTINRNTFYLSAGYDFDKKLEAGDSLKKSEGSNVYILIKNRTKEIIKFSNGSY